MEEINLYIAYNRHLWHVKIKTMDKPGFMDGKKAGYIIALLFNFSGMPLNWAI